MTSKRETVEDEAKREWQYSAHAPFLQMLPVQQVLATTLPPHILHLSLLFQLSCQKCSSGISLQIMVECIGMSLVTDALTLVMLNKLRCHYHFQLSANQIVWSRLLKQNHILNDKQCRSRSVASSEADWSRSTLFARAGYIRVQHGQG